MFVRYQFFFTGLLCTFLVSCSFKNDSNADAINKKCLKALATAEKKYQTDSLDQVIHYIDSSFAVEGGGTPEARIAKYDFFCNVYNNGTHEYLKARNYGDSMLQELKSCTNKKFKNEKLLVAYYNIGDACTGLKKYSEAFKYFYQAKAIAATAVDSFALQDFNYRLGMVMYRQHHYASANEYFKTSLRQIDYGDLNFQTFIRKQELINNTALTFFKTGLYDSAIVYYNRGLKYLETNKNLVGKRNLVEVAKGVIYGNLAQAYMSLNRLDLAEDLFKESIRINSQKGYDNRDANFSQIALGELYLAKNQTKKILPLINDLKTKLAGTNNEEGMLRLNELSYNYYKQVSEPLKALQSLEAANQMKDSLADKNKELAATDVDEVLSGIEGQYTIELLQKNNEFQKAVTLVALLILIMGISIILLVYKNYKKSRKHVVELTALNEKIEDKKEKLGEALASLEKESKSKDHILKIVAHDLRNPLNGIEGLTGIVLDEEGLTNRQRYVLSLVQTSCNDAKQLISEILEVAGAEEVKKLSKRLTDVNAMVSEAVDVLQNKAQEKNQRIVLDISQQPEHALINREKITRVISNLISNSIKFSPADKQIYVSTSHTEQGVIISVRDNGIGIPAELAGSVFETFTPAKRPGTLGEKSFGLGLSICRQIVEAHNGKIWFESEPGTGTTFHILLN